MGTFAHEYTHTHNIINMQSITQFSQSATLRVNANKASLNKSSKKVSVQVHAAVSMPSMDSQDEGDDVVASNPEAFVPQAPAAQKGNAVFSETAQLINGRAAMVGFVSAIAGEVITKKEAFELIFPAKMFLASRRTSSTRKTSLCLRSPSPSRRWAPSRRSLRKTTLTRAESLPSSRRTVKC